MEFSIEQFNRVKSDTENYYQGIGKVYCPYLSENVSFNAKGFNHLIFRSWNCTRALSDQYIRLRHFALAPLVIRNSKTLQGIWITKRFERIKKKDGKWQRVLKVITYYEFVAVLESHGSRVRVKVIVKQVDGGEKYFLSIIPNWGIDRKGRRVMHSGNPEED